ncbi:glutaredoxin family protein [candidate division FCPU426 bacterium]|nr:glutaredoxin family protein [candidate division FCPU426 bacterium]
MKNIIFYSLSTCIWCRKTRGHLDADKIKYKEIAVDTLSGAEKEKALAELGKVNPNRTFPTLIFENGKVVVGYKPEEIREAMKK